jgi:type I restriction enzyme S subunit
MSWRAVRLGELVDNFSVRAKDVGGADGLDFFGVSNEEGIIKTKYAAEDKAEDYKIIEKDCFAYNPYRVNVGSIGFVGNDTKGLISPAYVVFKIKQNSIIPELLFKFLKSDEGLNQIKFYARGTVRQALRFEDLCNIEITIPKYEEQKILYSKLIKSQEASKVLDTELKNQIELVKKLRQQLLQDAVQGKLLPQNTSRKLSGETGSELLKKIKAEKAKLIAEKKIKKEKELPPIKPEEIPFEIPDNWVWCRLGEVALFLNGYAFKSEWFKSEGMRLLRNINLGINELNWNDTVNISYTRADEFQEYLLKVGDIILSLDRPIINSGLKIAQIKKEDLPCLLLQRVLKVTPFLIDENYLYKWFNSNLFIDSINPGRSIGIPHISHNDVAKVLIPIPPIEEQIRVAKKLDELIQKCNELEESIKASQEQNEKLLQQVLREALRKEEVKK